MFIDHLGVVLFPEYELMRIVGRLAYPIFAYFIAQGCRYTKNKLRRFLNVFILGVICEAVYVLFMGSYFGNILLTFSVSIILIYVVSKARCEYAKNRLYGGFYFALFAILLTATGFYCKYVGLDYGFFGVMSPVVLTMLDKNFSNTEKSLWYNSQEFSLLLFTCSLILIAVFENLPYYQMYSLLAVLLLMMYNGKKGKYSFKYGFYLFYPLHLLLINGVAMILK
ncbi:MAG: hypothetical protein IKB73_04275 [Ruminococcus sp.]|nr:hypothetical protein [Ruminococcus sp.]